jgi:hypothetical protein
VCTLRRSKFYDNVHIIADSVILANVVSVGFVLRMIEFISVLFASDISIIVCQTKNNYPTFIVKIRIKYMYFFKFI